MLKHCQTSHWSTTGTSTTRSSGSPTYKARLTTVDTTDIHVLLTDGDWRMQIFQHPSRQRRGKRTPNLIHSSSTNYTLAHISKRIKQLNVISHPFLSSAKEHKHRQNRFPAIIQVNLSQMAPTVKNWRISIGESFMATTEHGLGGRC